MLDYLSHSTISELLEENLGKCDCVIILCRTNVVTLDEKIRPDIISEYHKSLHSGHEGISKTYRRIREKVYLPHFRDDVTDLIKKCTSCQEQKLTRIKICEPMIMIDTSTESFDKISIDTVGPLPITLSGNQHILTIQDSLTKFCTTVPIPDIKIDTIADA